MIIREAKREDLYSVATVQVESNRSTYKEIMPDDYLSNLSCEDKVNEWEQRLFINKNTEFMYVAETENLNIVGFVSASLVRMDNTFERELYSIYILKEFQRKGIGISLVKAVIEKYIQYNVRSMILWTLKDNPSRSFYENLGGRIVGNRIINRGGKELQQIAYAWDDITCIYGKRQ